MLPKLKQHPSRKYFTTQFILNFIIAIAVIAALQNEKIIFFKNIKNQTLDLLSFWHSYSEITLSDGQKMQNMVLFEIDDKTYRQWGSPIIMPRQQLKSLIEKAEHGGANVVTVDINLTWLSDGCIHAPDNTPTCSPLNFNDDVALGLYLQKLNQEFHHSNKYDTPIILLKRTYRKPLDENGTIKTDAFFQKPYSFLEAYIKKEKNVFWTSTFFEEDKGGWQLAALVCENDHLTVVPSMPLLATMAQLYSCKDSTRNAAYRIQELKHRLNAWAQTLPCDSSLGTTIPQICQKMACPDLTVTVPSKAGVCDNVHTIDLAKGRNTEKIVYRLLPPDNQNNSIDNYSAINVLEKKVAVDKQIVFIGITHQDNGDSVYFVANATDTLLRFGQWKPLPLAYQIGTSIIIAIILTLIFVYYQLITALLSSTLLLIVLFGFSGQALNHSLWVDVALVILIIQIVQVFQYIRTLKTE